MKNFGEELFGFSIKTKDVSNKILKTDTVEQLRQYSFTVDLSKLSSETINTGAIFIKGDRESSVIIANVKQNNRPFNLTGYTVSMNIQENFNPLETHICTIENAIDGIVAISLPAKYVDEEGECIFELCLQKDSKIILSQKYSYNVLGSLGEGNFGTDTQMSTLQQLIQQVQNQNTQLENITTELEVTQSDIDDIVGMIGGL